MRLLKNRRGAELIETLIIVAAFAAACVIAMTEIRKHTDKNLSNITQSLDANSNSSN